MRYLLLLLGACGFSAQAASSDAPVVSHDGRAIDGPTADAVVSIDAAPSPYMMACSASTLYRVDVVGQTATAVGSITGYSVFALAGDAHALYGIPSSFDQVLTIDPSNGNVTLARTITKHDFFGFGYADDLGLWFAGTDNTGEPASTAHLYTIDAATGVETLVGPFGGGLTIAGDLAWVHGHGLYGTFFGPGCMNTTCIASVNTTTGAATVLSTSGPSGALSLSGYGGRLWILDSSGSVWLVDTSNGNATFAFSTSVQWADAAN